MENSDVVSREPTRVESFLSSTASPGSASASTAESLRHFMAIQAERARIYNKFERGFLDYMRGGIEAPYQQLCSNVTTRFSDFSRQVFAVEAALRSGTPSGDGLADIVKKVQILEREKLQMTVTLQILRKAGHPSERSALDRLPSGSGAGSQGGHFSQSHRTKEATILPEQHACYHLSIAHGGRMEELGASGLADAEAAAEYSAAVGEATKRLQSIVVAINNCLEELQCELEDLIEA